MQDEFPTPSEPSRTSNVVPMLVASRDRPKDWRSQELQRVVFYLAGGVVSLLFLMLLAKQMNPKDDALLNAPLARVMGHWEGRWVGKETRFTLAGTQVASYQTVRFFSSSTSQYQSGTVERTEGDKHHVKQIWLTKIDQDGILSARRNDEGDENFELFGGNLVADTIFWTSERPESQQLVRLWIVGTVLNVEELYVSRTRPADSYLITGRYERAEE